MAIDPETGEVTFIPPEEGEALIVIEVQDGEGGIDSQTFVIAIAPAISALVMSD